jgi:hypothetical protein
VLIFGPLAIERWVGKVRRVSEREDEPARPPAFPKPAASTEEML